MPLCYVLGAFFTNKSYIYLVNFSTTFGRSRRQKRIIKTNDIMKKLLFFCMALFTAAVVCAQDVPYSKYLNYGEDYKASVQIW